MKNLKTQIDFLESVYNKQTYYNVDFKKDGGASIDIAHAMLLFGIILSQKPNAILELGIGTGVASETILNGIKYNSNDCQYDAVDFCMRYCEETKSYVYHGNWAYPTEAYIEKLRQEKVNLIGLDEKIFVESCDSDKYDLIISDADHERAGEWAQHIFRICKDGGVILMHDVACNEYKSLKKYIEYVEDNKIPYFMFKKNSRPEEICHRGWMMILNKKQTT